MAFYNKFTTILLIFRLKAGDAAGFYIRIKECASSFKYAACGVCQQYYFHHHQAYLFGAYNELYRQIPFVI